MSDFIRMTEIEKTKAIWRTCLLCNLFVPVIRFQKNRVTAAGLMVKTIQTVRRQTHLITAHVPTAGKE
jgi:hypothetical protein